MGRQILGVPLDRVSENLAPGSRSTTDLQRDLGQVFNLFASWFSPQYSKGLSYVTTMFVSSSDILKVRCGM